MASPNFQTYNPRTQLHSRNLRPRSPPLQWSSRSHSAPPSPNPRTQTNRTTAESFAKSWDEADIVIGCEYHTNCLPVTRSEFITLIRNVYNCAVELVEYLFGPEIHQFHRGIEEIFFEMMRGEFWRYNECRYCWIQRFITGDACGAWFLSLWVLRRRYEFYQGMHFMETLGHDTRRVTEWIDRVLDCVD